MRLEKGPRFFVLEAIQDGISWLVRIHNEKKQTVADGAMDGRTIEKELCETVSKLKQNLIEGGKAS